MNVHSGKRKSAVARGTFRKGKGNITVNSKPVDVYAQGFYALKIREPALLLPEIAKKVDISIKVNGGGMNGQADACRIVVAKALLDFSGNDEAVEKMLTDYDRNMLIADVRRKEKRKPNTGGKARAKTQKSYR